MKKRILTYCLLLFTLSLLGQTFYGLTAGANSTTSLGTLFKCNVSGNFNTLEHFNGPDGAKPYGNLILVGDSNLYGMALPENRTTWGTLAGTIFKYNIVTEAFTTVLSFDSTIGSIPYGSLLLGKDGNLYGVTSSGSADSSEGSVFGCTPAGKLTFMTDFKSISEGAYPDGSLIQATDGYLYGMTSMGGTYDSGTIFKCSTTGTITPLVSLSQLSGKLPEGSLIQANNGNLYGMTSTGGKYNMGTLFMYSITNNTFTVLDNFNGSNGAYPYGSLMQANDGNLYGMTEGGIGSGTVFRCSLTGTIDTLFTFDSNAAAHPTGDLIQASDGYLYGLTGGGATTVTSGSVFRCATTGGLTTLYSDSTYNLAFPHGSLLQVSGITGINTIDTPTNKILLYPNPAASSITIQSSTESNNALLEVYNVIGEKVFAQHFSNTNNQYTIDISSLANGLYFTTIVTDKGSQTIKFIKQ